MKSLRSLFRRGVLLSRNDAVGRRSARLRALRKRARQRAAYEVTIQFSNLRGQSRPTEWTRLSLVPALPLAAAELKTLLDSAQPGPTILLVNTPASDDVSGAIAFQQVSRWTLTQGKIVAATGGDWTDLIRKTSPAAVVMLTVGKSVPADAPAASILARGLDAGPLREKLNAILDAGTAPLVATAAPPLGAPGAATPKIKVALYAGGGSSTTPGLAAYPACLDRPALRGRVSRRGGLPSGWRRRRRGVLP